jgi:hypothetical protein
MYMSMPPLIATSNPTDTTTIGALDVSVTADTSDTAAIGAKRDEAVSEHRDI